MKKNSIFLIISLVAFSICANAQIKVVSNGNVGINNTAPTYKLDVNGTGRFITGTFSGINTGILLGTYYTDGILDPLIDNRGIIGYNNKWKQAYINNIWTAVPVTVSDEKLKENVTPLSNSLETILKLRGVKYDLKPEYFMAKDSDGKVQDKNDILLKSRIGFIAQEMALVLPGLVLYDSVKQLQGIVYENLIPVLVEAIKEQQIEINELKGVVAKCCEANLKSASTLGTENLVENIATLDQNIPNPFNQETRIGCYIPVSSTTSVLYIYNMNGAQLQQYNITSKGQQTVTINGNSLEPGMYLYALVVNGKEVDTKRMILTK